MHNRFDQLGKQIGCEGLGPSGPTVAQDEIAPDAQHADLRHEPDPKRDAERARLGLLGRLAAVLCLIEIYSDAPDDDEVLACVGKLIAFRQKRARSFRQKRATPAPDPQEAEVFVKPRLWIITAGRPSSVLADLGATSSPDWPTGVYFASGLFRTAIVVGNELPRDRSTLLVRLMAAGPLLPQAIEDLSRLPPDAHERAVAGPILLNLQHVLGNKPSRTPEEQEFIVTMQDTWEKAREQGWEAGRKQGHDEGHKEGRDEGRSEEAARAVLTALRVRGIAVPDAARERILATKEPSLLERMLEKAIVAASLADVIDEPS